MLPVFFEFLILICATMTYGFQGFLAAFLILWLINYVFMEE